jgi:hypothetical protein
MRGVVGGGTGTATWASAHSRRRRWKPLECPGQSPGRAAAPPFGPSPATDLQRLGGSSRGSCTFLPVESDGISRQSLQDGGVLFFLPSTNISSHHHTNLDLSSSSLHPHRPLFFFSSIEKRKISPSCICSRALPTVL